MFQAFVKVFRQKYENRPQMWNKFNTCNIWFAFEREKTERKTNACRLNETFLQVIWQTRKPTSIHIHNQCPSINTIWYKSKKKKLTIYFELSFGTSLSELTTFETGSSYFLFILIYYFYKERKPHYYKQMLCNWKNQF
jgi:hypothetical protein